MGDTDLFRDDQEEGFTRSNRASKNIDTRLIIENRKDLPINQVESELWYDQKGENIVVNSTQNIVQDITPEKTFNTVLVPYDKRTRSFFRTHFPHKRLRLLGSFGN